MSSKKANNTILVPIMALYFLTATQVATNSAMAEISAAFPTVGAGVAYVTSIVALGMVPAALISGSIAGKKVSYRTISIVSLVLYVVAGCVPYFLGDVLGFAGLLASRFVFGIAVGFFSPLPNALVSLIYTDENKRASAMGYGNAVLAMGAVVTQLLAGYLALVSWRTPFLLYLVFGIAGLLLVIAFLHDPKDLANTNEEAEQQSVGEKDDGDRVHIPGLAFGILVAFSACCALNMPLQTYCSLILESSGLGDTALAGTSLSAMTVSCTVASLLFGRIYKHIGNWALPAGVMLIIIGNLMCFAASSDMASLPLWICGFLAAGFGMMLMNVSIPQLLSLAVPKNAITLVMGLHMVFQNIGNFLGTPFAQLIVSVTKTADMRVVILAASVFFVPVVIALMMLVRKTNAGREAAQEA